MKLPGIIAGICSLAICATTFAQRNVAGLLLKAADFNDLRFVEKPAAGEQRIIRLNEVVPLPYVTVVSNGHKKRFQKDSLFGYQLADGRIFRFYKRSSFEILSVDTGLLLYRQKFITGGKVPQSFASYYFSRSAAAPIMPLTRAALAAAFSDDAAFPEQVYESFASDADLIQYDSYFKVYNLSRVYRRTHVPKH